MEVKGTSVSSTRDYVRKKFPDRYSDWLTSLPGESRQIYDEGVFANQWYPLQEAYVLPTEKIGDLFFNGDHFKAAWDSGRFSAESALKGLYWFYVRAGNPRHIIQRATRIFSAYFSPSELVVENMDKQSLEVVIKQFDAPHQVVEARIAGWIEQALEISGCKRIRVNIGQSMTRGDAVTRFEVQWNG